MKFLNNIIYFYTNNIYYEIINFYIKNKFNYILIQLFSEEEKKFLCNKIIMWIFCINKKNINPCFKCKNCLLIKNNNHPDILKFSLNLFNYFNVNDIKLINIFNYESFYNKKLIYIQNIEYIYKKIENILLKKIENTKNIIYIFSCNEIKHINFSLYNKFFLFTTNCINKKFLENYINTNLNLNKSEKILLIELSDNSIFNCINIFNSNFIINNNILFDYIKLSIKEKNFVKLFSILSNNNFKNFILLKILILFIIDTLYFYKCKKIIFNTNRKKIIILFLLSINIKNIFVILENLLFYYNIFNNRRINNKIILMYNLLYINKNLK